MNFYPHFIGDYQRDTAHLSAEQDGIYRRLLDAYYGSERPLPCDFDTLCRIARAITETERVSLGFVLGSFFVLDEAAGVYRNDRCDSEIAKAQKRIVTARRNGTSGGRPSKAENPSETQRDSQREPSGLPSGITLHHHNQVTTASAASPRPANLADRFDAPHHREAYLEMLTSSRSPRALDYEVRLLAEGGERPGAGADGVVKPHGWDVVGEAIHAMRVSGAALTPRSLSGFCRRLVEPDEPDQRRGGGRRGGGEEKQGESLHDRALRLARETTGR